MKTYREFLEHTTLSDSYFVVEVDKESGSVSLKLTDCDRRIWWHFGKPGDKRAIAKIKKIKRMVDRVHAHLAGEST